MAPLLGPTRDEKMQMRTGRPRGERSSRDEGGFGEQLTLLQDVLVANLELEGYLGRELGPRQGCGHTSEEAVSQTW